MFAVENLTPTRADWKELICRSLGPASIHGTRTSVGSVYTGAHSRKSRESSYISDGNGFVPSRAFLAQSMLQFRPG
jgi:hypothetical protein